MWRIATDYLRCHPDFHERARYDYVLVQHDQGITVAQMSGVFRVHVPDVDKTYTVVLVKPLRIVAQRSKEKELGLIRLIPTHNSQFIFADTIIRGAHVIPDWSEPLPQRSYILNDVVDGDMFLRLRIDFPGYTLGVRMTLPEHEDELLTGNEGEESDGGDQDDHYEHLYVSDNE